MKRAIHLFLILFAITTGTARADHQFLNISESLADSRMGRVAASQEGVVVVVWEEDDGIWTRGIVQDQIFPHVYHGVGIQPTICRSAEGFTLAWARESTVLIRSGNGLSWSDLEVFENPSGAARKPHLSAMQPMMSAHQVYLAWEELGRGVWFAERIGGIWDAQQSVCEIDDLIESKPHAVPTYQWEPRVYIDNVWNLGLEYYDRVGEVWLGPYTLHDEPYYLGTEFDCTAGADEAQHVLSLGPPATCPCNQIFYTEQFAGGPWSEPENLTVGGAFYDWPQCPSLAVDADGTLHAFWYEEYRDAEFNFLGDAMFYMTMTPLWTDWEDHTDILGEEVGTHNDICVNYWDQPIFVYTVGEYPHRDVKIGLNMIISDVQSTPPPILCVSAHPNPFNPRTQIRYSIPSAGEVSLSVFDIHGRRLNVLQQGRQEAGEHIVEWSGRDETGQIMSSGVYFAKLTNAGRIAVLKLLLLK